MDRIRKLEAMMDYCTFTRGAGGLLNMIIATQPFSTDGVEEVPAGMRAFVSHDIPSILSFVDESSRAFGAVVLVALGKVW